MTTINCDLNCTHQKDGKCTLDNAENAECANDSCAYFSPSKPKEKDR